MAGRFLVIITLASALASVSALASASVMYSQSMGPLHRGPFTPLRPVSVNTSTGRKHGMYTACVPVVHGPFTRPWPWRTSPRPCTDRIHRRASAMYTVVMYTGVFTARVHGCSRPYTPDPLHGHTYPNTAVYRAHGRLYGL